MVVGSDRQTGEKDMRKRTWLTGMTVLDEFLLIRIKTKESQVRCNPHHMVPLQYSRDITVLQRSQYGGNLLTHQLTVFHHQAKDTALYTHPGFPIAFNVADSYIEHPPGMGIVIDLVNLAFSGKCHKTYLTVVNNPYTSDAIAITADRRLHEQLLQLRMIRNHRFHRPQIHNVDALIKGHPKPMVRILRYTPARLAVQAKPGHHHAIAIISHQATAISRNPKESVRILEDISHVVMWKSVAQIEKRQIIALGQHGSLCYTESCPP